MELAKRMYSDNVVRSWLCGSESSWYNAMVVAVRPSNEAFYKKVFEVIEEKEGRKSEGNVTKKIYIDRKMLKELGYEIVTKDLNKLEV